MLYLPKMLAPDLIRPKIVAKDKWALLDKMADLMASNKPQAHGKPLDRQTIYEAVEKRELERTSAIGQGCALPHARISGLDRPVACLVTLDPPVDFGADDHEPVSIACLLLVPEDDPSSTLKIMAEVALLMSEDKNRQFMASTSDATTLHGFLDGLSTGVEMPLVARNIMRGPFFAVYPETPLIEVTRLLQQHLLEACGVHDREGHLVGVITCDSLFQYGFPEFFGQLKSVAFIRKFDPFENYFKGLKTATAGDVMSTDFSALPEDATLLEVVFELAVRKHAKVFVVRDGILTGIIDRITVLNRVLNF
ncbi:MAG: PTS sugar transporter subunit IIA [Candidatus Hydrogenedentes bacterium]|nr:PTS sugar transporter subunit IIA [Candidatus Hydrogenedentota bacterium]